MTNFEFLAFLFVGFLAAIVFGIFVGLAIADRQMQRHGRELMDITADVMEKIEAANTTVTRAVENIQAELDAMSAGDVLEAEEIE